MHTGETGLSSRTFATLWQVKYQSIGLAWAIRGICLFFFAFLAIILLFLLHTGSRVARYLGGEVTQEECGVVDDAIVTEDGDVVCCEQGCLR